jgi:hypothetical protein
LVPANPAYSGGFDSHYDQLNIRKIVGQSMRSGKINECFIMVGAKPYKISGSRDLPFLHKYKVPVEIK